MSRHALPVSDAELLELPEAQPIIARLGGAVDPEYPQRMGHVLRVASMVIRAKRNPTNSFAKATL